MQLLNALLENFNFAEPVFLYLIILLTALFLIWLLVVLVKLVSRPEKTYHSKYPLIGKIKLWGIFVLLASVFMVIALARPSISREGVKPTRGDVEVVILFDNSFSMKADDLKPLRLEIAKREILSIEPFLEEEDKAGLFTFGQASHRKLYLTSDFETLFDQVSKAGFPKNLIGDETIFDTDFTTALEHIYQSLDRQDAFNEGHSRNQRQHYNPEKRTNRIVLIFSDGEDQVLNFKSQVKEEIEARAEYIKRQAQVLVEYRKRGLKIYPVGLGTRKGASWLSLLKGYKKGTDYSEELEKEWAGQITRLDRANLAALAKATGVNLSGYDWTVESVQGNVRDYLEHALNSNRRLSFELTEGNGSQQLWQYCLLVATGFLMLGIATYPFSGYLRNKKM